MKHLPSRIFFTIAIMTIILVIVYIVKPFSLIDMEQVQRIAKWKSEYENFVYYFDLVKLHEGSIIPSNNEDKNLISEEYILSRLKPYMNIEYAIPVKVLKYTYRKMNGSKLKPQNQFYFKKFAQTKNGMLISIKANKNYKEDEETPEFYMLIDINGVKKPNRIGKDIFFINIYKDHISALGEGKTNTKVQISCSPIGNGLYCSENYLLGGQI